MVYEICKIKTEVGRTAILIYFTLLTSKVLLCFLLKQCYEANVQGILLTTCVVYNSSQKKFPQLLEAFP